MLTTIVDRSYEIQISCICSCRRNFIMVAEIGYTMHWTHVRMNPLLDNKIPKPSNCYVDFNKAPNFYFYFLFSIYLSHRIWTAVRIFGTLFFTSVMPPKERNMLKVFTFRHTQLQDCYKIWSTLPSLGAHSKLQKITLKATPETHIN